MPTYRSLSPARLVVEHLGADVRLESSLRRDSTLCPRSITHNLLQPNRHASSIMLCEVPSDKAIRTYGKHDCGHNRLNGPECKLPSSSPFYWSSLNDRFLWSGLVRCRCVFCGGENPTQQDHHGSIRCRGRGFICIVMLAKAAFTTRVTWPIRYQ